MSSLPKTVTRQRRCCDLNPGPSAPESSTLTTRLPSHPYAVHSMQCISMSISSPCVCVFVRVCSQTEAKETLEQLHSLLQDELANTENLPQPLTSRSQ